MTLTPKQFEQLFEGNVNRFHAHPIDALRNGGDTNQAHSERVYRIAFEIVSLDRGDVISTDLIYACKYHDLPEAIMGDWPYTLTRDYRIARWAKAILEWQIKRKMGLHWKLTPREKLILALADKLDAYEFAASRITLNQLALYFSGDLDAMYGIARKLGPDVAQWLSDRLQKECKA